jgi:DNA-binding Lrp family transcriptional regulator
LYQNIDDIETDTLHTRELKQHFKKGHEFRSKDLNDFYQSISPNLNLKKTSLNWRIYKLVQLGVIQRIGRGIFILGETSNFKPEISKSLKNKYDKIKAEYPFVEFCLWNTSVFNEFSSHQTNKNFTIIEVEKDSAESIFHFLKESNNNVFINPDKDILLQYIYDIINPIIIKTLISESPLQMVNKVQTITIEKMLVDLFSDTVIFDLFQGNERSIIYTEAFEKYTINNNKLLRYASRRGKKEEIQEYINLIIGNKQDYCQNIVNDR